MKLLLSYGTRPEWLKIKPLIAALRKDGTIPFRILFTGQHEHIAVGEYDVSVDISKLKSVNSSWQHERNRLNAIVCSILDEDNADEVYLNLFDGITHTIVQGDTTSAFAVALSSFHRGIPVIHLEAGLRTYESTPYPEEANRRMIDAMSSYFLCPTPQNKNNLKHEGYNEHKAYVTGNTGLDNLIGIPTTFTDVVLCTMHRRENHARMDEWFKVINQLALDNPNLSFIMPVHPNPNVKRWIHLLPNVKTVQPLEYMDMLQMLSVCRFVITDSGGLQEECSFLKKYAIVCREFTERPESLGKFTFLAKTPEELPVWFNKIKDNYKPDDYPCPFGDGKSSELVIEVLKQIK